METSDKSEENIRVAKIEEASEVIWDLVATQTLKHELAAIEIINVLIALCVRICASTKQPRLMFREVMDSMESVEASPMIENMAEHIAEQIRKLLEE